MKKNTFPILLLLALAFSQNNAFAQAKIKAYFNHPVNNSVSTGVDAVYLPGGTLGDTLVAYINRAKHTLDIAEYDYNQTSNDGSYANIATAVNNAYTRGVTVRWIYDESSSNTGLAALNSGIHTLCNPSTSSGIMHNKFMIIDANDGNPDDAILKTGSEDWSSEMMYDDYNNVLFIQDSALAYAYTQEFNMMWGSTTAVPNASLAKFGSAKTDLGLHSFMIGGKAVYLYFSPSDGANTQLENAIESANTDLYLGMYDLTESANASDIAAKHTAGVYTHAILDQYSYSTSGAYPTISGLGATNFVEYTGRYIYHNKMLIVDPSNICSDPQVETGSENWTSSGTNYNDENILIIHSDTLANIYYQAFYQDFVGLGGADLAVVAGCTTGIAPVSKAEDNTTIFPNPASEDITISYQLSSAQTADISISDIMGQKIADIVTSEPQDAGKYTYGYHFTAAGIYLVQFTMGSEHYIKKVVVAGE